MILLIAGSRDFQDFDLLEEKLEPYKNEIEEIVSGMANGADKLGVKYSTKHMIPLREFPAQWDLHGRRAGMLRNIEMAQYLNQQDDTMAMVFWDGSSRGTENMISLLKKYNIRHEVVIYGKRSS